MNVYLVKMRSRTDNEEDNEEFYKVGITQHENIMLRFTSHGTETVHNSNLPKLEKLRRAFAGELFLPPYAIEVVHQVEFAQNKDAARIEAEILDAVRPQKYIPKNEFGGRTECFTANDSQITIVKEYMTDVASSADLGVP